MKTVVMFSGQGSQYPLMGYDFFTLKENEEKILIANKILNFDILEVIKNKKNELSNTLYVQPLMVLMQMLIFDKFIKRNKVDALVGFSLGEYSTLYASNIYSFEETLKLVKIRSKLMLESTENNPGKMVAVLNFDESKLKSIINKINNDQDKIVTIANYNSKNQLVISGDNKSVDEVLNKLKELKVRRLINLDVSGAFHSKLMFDASLKLNKYLNTLTKNKNKIDIYLNTTANKLKINELEDMLTKQIYSPVLFYQSIEKLIDDGYTNFIEIGPKKVLYNLVKRNYNNINVKQIETLEDLNNLKE